MEQIIITGISAIVSVLGIQTITSFYKATQARYTDTQIHVFVFFLSVAVSGMWAFAQINPSFMTFLERAGSFTMAAISTYEIFWKQWGSTTGTSLPN